MAKVELGARVFAVNKFRHFISEVEAARTKTVQDTTEWAADLAVSLAPERTGALKDSIKPVMFSAREGGVVVGVSYWRHQEFGTRAHYIPSGGPRLGGHLFFFWEKEGRMFGAPYPNYVWHPGNPEIGFMRKAGKQARYEMMERLRGNMP